jgi:hypothetical protein
MTFFDSKGMTSYSQIIHFIALEPTVKEILSINKIFLYFSSLEAATAKVLVTRRCHSQIKIFKGNVFLAHFGSLCALCAFD